MPLRMGQEAMSGRTLQGDDAVNCLDQPCTVLQSHERCSCMLRCCLWDAMGNKAPSRERTLASTPATTSYTYTSCALVAAAACSPSADSSAAAQGSGSGAVFASARTTLSSGDGA